mgnify:CR=1 FL=1
MVSVIVVVLSAVMIIYALMLYNIRAVGTVRKWGIVLRRLAPIVGALALAPTPVPAVLAAYLAYLKDPYELSLGYLAHCITVSSYTMPRLANMLPPRWRTVIQNAMQEPAPNVFPYIFAHTRNSLPAVILAQLILNRSPLFWDQTVMTLRIFEDVKRQIDQMTATISLAGVAIPGALAILMGMVFFVLHPPLKAWAVVNGAMGLLGALQAIWARRLSQCW